MPTALQQGVLAWLGACLLCKARQARGCQPTRIRLNRRDCESTAPPGVAGGRLLSQCFVRLIGNGCCPTTSLLGSMEPQQPPAIAWLEALTQTDDWLIEKVTKTAAMELFRLPAKQLEGLDHTKQRNRHGPYPMRLYVREQVYQRAVAFHRSKLERAAARWVP